MGLGTGVCASGNMEDNRVSQRACEGEDKVVVCSRKRGRFEVMTEGALYKTCSRSPETKVLCILAYKE